MFTPEDGYDIEVVFSSDPEAREENEAMVEVEEVISSSAPALPTLPAPSAPQEFQERSKGSMDVTDERPGKNLRPMPWTAKCC